MYYMAYVFKVICFDYKSQLTKLYEILTLMKFSIKKKNIKT